MLSIDLEPMIKYKYMTSDTDQQNFLYKLCDHDFEIIYKPGHLNKATDALSIRYEEEKEVKEESLLKCWSLMEGKDSKVGYSLQGDLLLYKGKTVIPT